MLREANSRPSDCDPERLFVHGTQPGAQRRSENLRRTRHRLRSVGTSWNGGPVGVGRGQPLTYDFEVITDFLRLGSGKGISRVCNYGWSFESERRTVYSEIVENFI